MKIIYCIAGLRRSGGMERVLTNKANYLAERGFDILIITTDQYGEDNFFSLSPKIRTIDIAINYEENNGRSFGRKLFNYPLKQRRHKKRLRELLMQENADIVISMFCNDASFLWKINDGSEKILEIHFSRFKRLQYGRKGVWGWADRLRSRHDLDVVKRYDRFVVLTQEDRGYWGNLSNMTVIPNALTFEPEECAELINKQVIAVGRYDYQKGFDELISAWALISTKYPDWKLCIFGNGELRKELQLLVYDLGLEKSLKLCSPVQNIGNEYKNSSVLVMSSRYEGLPMTLLEGQAFGLPIVSYACKCGPRDIITEGEDGFLVPVGDVKSLADRMTRLMADQELRKRMGRMSKINSTRFSEEKVMTQWIDLFNDITKGK